MMNDLKLKFLALDAAELRVLQKLGRTIISNYERKPLTESEPTPAEFQIMYELFCRVMEL